MNMSERRTLALSLLENDHLSYAEIGRRLGVGRTRAREIVRTAENCRHDAGSGTIRELSHRSFWCLRGLGLDDDTTAADLARHIQRLRDGVNCRRPTSIHNFGRESLNEVERWIEAAGVSLSSVGGESFLRKL